MSGQDHTALFCRIHKAIVLLTRYGSIDGAHHKQWVIDQLARILLDDGYEQWKHNLEHDGYECEEGVAP
jgi:hypothetical protein